MKSVLVLVLALAAFVVESPAAKPGNAIPPEADAALRNAKEIILLSLQPYPCLMHEGRGLNGHSGRLLCHAT